MNSAVKPIKVAGELFWATWMENFNTKFDEDNKRYEITLGSLSEKAVTALEELGIRVKDRDPMGKHIVGKSKFKFEPVDTDGKPVDIAKIGNGTKAYVLVTPYRHKMSAKYGASPSVKTKVFITELKEYNPEAKVAEEEEDEIL